jgi:tetraacyldisaccharide 4'-kinase
LKLSDGQPLLFTTLRYASPVGIFPEADAHYVYSPKCILITGIAHGKLFQDYLSDTYKIGRSFRLPDHHAYTRADVRKLESAARQVPTACLMTTEKDAQRLRDCKNVPQSIRERLFFVPIEAAFLQEEEQAAFTAALLAAL